MRRLLLVVLAVFLLGCTQRTGRVYRAQTVKGIAVQEDALLAMRLWRGTSDYTLRAALVQPISPFWSYKFEPANPRIELDLAELYRDSWRLELWYAHHGFFDARVMGWDIRPHRSYLRARMTPSVLAVARVHEGEPSLVRSVDVTGVKRGLGMVLETAQKESDLQVGSRFSLASVESTADEFRRVLAARSYALAKVSSSVQVFPEEHAVDVTYTIDRGPVCRFGEVTVSGHENVPDAFVQGEITIQEGDKFSSETIAETQVRLFGLGVFSLVKIQPDLSREDKIVPVRIELVEATFHEVRVGTGIGIESGEQLAQVSAQFTNSNVFNRLWNFEAEVAAGYRTFSNRVVPAWTDLSTNNAGFFALSEARLVLPRFPRRTLEPRLGVTGELGRDQRSTYLRAELGPALTWRFRPRHSLTVGYHLERWTGVLDDAIEEAERIAGDVDLYNTESTSWEIWALEALDIEGGGSYNLTYFDVGYLWRSTKDLTNPRNGEYVSLGATLAGLPTGFSFWRAQVDLRMYRFLRRYISRKRKPLRKLFKQYKPIFAARLGGGYARGYSLDWGPFEGNQPYVHPNYRFTLGGSNDVRGWSADQLGPTACSFEDSPKPGSLPGSRTCVPIGGELSMFASLELRMRLVGDLGIAIFNDWGMAWKNPGDVSGRLPPQPSVGAGLRYATPIGPIRLDFGWRIPLGEIPKTPRHETYRFREQPRWAIHFALTEAF